MDILSYIMGVKAGKASGGGSVEGACYVTFMSEDGTTELYKRAVIKDDDCGDPVKRGYISEPVKESTAQYNYTLVGWSATPNGALDENILKSVTADKTVYANYAAVVRYYTVNYYDGETWLKTESLAYGTMPSYAPTKSGFNFNGWTPNAVVTGNMNYTALWKAKATFETMTWAEIAATCDAGNAQTTFAIGDKRTETITYKDGTTEDVEFEVVDLRLGEYSFTKPDNARMIIMSTHVLKNARPYHNSSFTQYYNCSLGNYLTNELLPCFPEEMQAVMQNTSWPYIMNPYTSKLVIPCAHMFGKTYDSKGESDSPIHALDKYETNRSLVCKKKDGTAVDWWLSNTYSSGACYVRTTGALDYASESTSKYIRLVFCI